ncbi:TolC family protein [Allohahella sp. A8]|uniref:TolC family protein n=1 Tax=Allohahella sp. A8 TaxID=3141461 RepID=UPI003A809097
MNTLRPLRPALLLAIVIASGCASVDISESVKQTNDRASAFTGGELQLGAADEQRLEMQTAATELLKQPLGEAEAVRVALLNSPRMQLLVARYWANAAAIADEGRIPNPVFAFERIEVGDELEITRALSIGLIDILTYPQRYDRAQQALAAAQLGLTSTVIGEVTAVRQAWVQAVGARERLGYAEQVYQSGEASAELAQRMKAAGNFSELARARQQVFYSDAATSLANARHEALRARESLVQILGLTEKQYGALKLPDRLPKIPDAPVNAEAIGTMAVEERLDVQMAKAEFEAAAEAQGFTLLTSFTDIEVGAIRETAFGDEGRESAWGYEFELTLPLFNLGGMAREAMNARTLAAANNLELTLRTVSSELRAQYSTYRSAYDIALHYRTNVIPLRQKIMDESVLRYNGMIIGVFELLADYRSHVAAVVSAINANQAFWMAEAGLKSARAGVSMGAASSLSDQPNASGGDDEGH